jgi:hypothetical protein
MLKKEMTICENVEGIGKVLCVCRVIHIVTLNHCNILKMFGASNNARCLGCI